MKKIVILVISLILVFITNSAFGETDGLLSTGVVVDTGSVMETQTSTNTGSEVIDNSSIGEATYMYYYGEGCSHCINVEEYMQGVDGYDKLNITKKEIYFDDANRAEYLAAGERLGIAEADLGIPFLVINDGLKESSLIGDENIINYFKPYLGEFEKTSKKTVILVIMGILAVLIPVVLIKLTNKN